MEKIVFDSEYFNPKDTLTCGQIFRFTPFGKGYKVFSTDKCAYLYVENESTVVECDACDLAYFHNFFDLERDYESIYSFAVSENIPALTMAANKAKGIRILNQDCTEMLFSFIISQNNNIPRISGIIERLSTALGEKKTFMGEDYYSFPTAQKMSEQSVDFFYKVGLGYRAPYIKRLADDIVKGFNVEGLKELSTTQLKKSLLSIYGVGAKVADCVALFGFHRSDSFPVDTWIEKVYREDFGGQIKDRAKISEYLVGRFKENAGYYQQYLFHYKRQGEN